MLAFINKLENHQALELYPQLKHVIRHFKERLTDPGLAPADREQALVELKEELTSFKELTETIDDIFPGLNLRQQYLSQVDVAKKSGMFRGKVAYGIMQAKNIPLIIRGDDTYAIPEWTRIQQILMSKKALIKEKAAEGFTRMLIVPFAYDLKEMYASLRHVLRRRNGEGGLDEKEQDYYLLHPETNGPLFVDADCEDESNLIYYPEKLDPEECGGERKEKVIADDGAWQICFVKEKVEEHGFLNIEIPDFGEGERGMNLEQYIWMHLTYMLGGDKPVEPDHCGSFSELEISLTGVYNPVVRDLLTVASWDDEGFLHIQDIHPHTKNSMNKRADRSCVLIK